MIENTIQILPNELINQIKAGEVVERPASIVKELVENSIDAGSTLIAIDLLDGGKQLIKISDNGLGINSKSLPLALERHATSKLKILTDLNTLQSFGFRGEALPSIASVSEFSIRSKTNSQNLGFEIQVNQGKTSNLKEVTMQTGTLISVKNLFYNVPARLKFLKSTTTEYSHIHDFLMSICFYYYKISFRLSHNGRDVFNFKCQNTMEKRFQEILDHKSQDFVPLSYERGSFKLSGFSLLPEKATTLAQHFITFVNGRLVKDKVIRAGVLQAYQGLILKGMTPSGLFFIDVDPSWIDVNVHPSKIEVRFSDPIALQELIAMGIQNSLKASIQKQFSPQVQKQSSNAIFNEPNKVTNTFKQQANSIVKNTPIPQYQPSFSDIKQRHNLTQLKTNIKSYSEPTIQFNIEKEKTNNVFEKVNNIIEQQEQKIVNEIAPENNILSVFSDAQYLGQYHKCYLMMEKNSELWIVDQHAFHERILFEEYTKEYAKHPIPKQMLMTPFIFCASEKISQIAQEYHEKIGILGFEIEILTNKNIAIHSHPAFLPYEKIQSTMEDLFNKLMNDEIVNPTRFYHLFYATLACHSAVRAGDSLNEELVKRLLHRSNHVDFFAHCPHGRPVLRKFEKKDVESWFLRI